MDVVGRVRLAPLLFGATLLLVGCSGYVNRGSALYADGHYIEAAQVFEHTESRLAESNPREQAEYGLYRGLTLLVLGDLHGSEQWLQYASKVDGANPDALRPETRELLGRGLTELDTRRREAPPLAGPPNTAVAASEPAAPIRPARQ